MRRMLLFSAIVLSSAGCGFDVFYAFHAVEGQAEILFGSIPIEDAISNTETPFASREKLEMVVDLRGFARDEVRLNVETSYATYYDGGESPVAYSVSAAHGDSLEPLQWEFPFFGSIPFLSYFDQFRADMKVIELEFLGYDAFLYELDAYSLAVLPNPVLSPMLNRDEIDLATLVFHELTHRTVGRPDDGTDLDNRFNESVATYVGRRAALDYFEARDGADSTRTAEAAARYNDDDLVTAFMLDFADQLEAMYSTGIAADELRERKSQMFAEARATFATSVAPQLQFPLRYGLLNEMPESNAFVLLYQRYNERQTLFDEVFEANGRDWGATLIVYRQAAASAGDPFDYMDRWLANQ